MIYFTIDHQYLAGHCFSGPGCTIIASKMIHHIFPCIDLWTIV